MAQIGTERRYVPGHCIAISTALFKTSNSECVAEIVDVGLATVADMLQPHFFHQPGKYALQPSVLGRFSCETDEYFVGICGQDFPSRKIPFHGGDCRWMQRYQSTLLEFRFKNEQTVIGDVTQSK
jgi:hypothetical protein